MAKKKLSTAASDIKKLAPNSLDQFKRGFKSVVSFKKGGPTPRSKDEYRKPGIKSQPLSEYSGAPFYKKSGNLIPEGATRNPYTGEKLKGAPTSLNKAGTAAKKTTSKKMGGSTKSKKK